MLIELLSITTPLISYLKLLEIQKVGNPTLQAPGQVLHVDIQAVLQK